MKTDYICKNIEQYYINEYFMDEIELNCLRLIIELLYEERVLTLDFLDYLYQTYIKDREDEEIYNLFNNLLKLSEEYCDCKQYLFKERSCIFKEIDNMYKGICYVENNRLQLSFIFERV